MMLHCIEMQKMAETKNAGLLAFNGAMILTATRVLFDPGMLLPVRVYCAYAALCSVVSVFLNLSAISAQLHYRRVPPSPHSAGNLQFFGEVANQDPQEYLVALNREYFGNEEPLTTYHRHLASQIVVNAQIAMRKFQLFNTAFKWTICGVASPAGLLILRRFDRGE